nr:zinc knuckle CX2CX4HX4C [Tanacetum cinerariifolium]
MEKKSSGANNGAKPLKLILKKTSRGETIVGDDSGLPQSALVTPTPHLPLHQSNVDVAATFRVSFSTVGDLKVLITDIDAGALCDFIKVESASSPGFESDGSRNESSVSVTMYTSSLVEKVLIHSIDDVSTLFGVPPNFLKDIDEFTKDLEVGKYDLWLELTKETRSGITNIIWNRWDTLVNLQKSAPTIDDNLFGVAGASAKDQPKVNFNFHHFVADPLFDGVNISIPCKVVKKRMSLIDTSIGKPVVLDSYTSSMCNDSWGRSSFAWCLIKVNSEADFMDVVTIGIPSLIGDGFTKETICVEYEWRPPWGDNKDNISTSNSFSALNDDEEDGDEAIENVYDESANLFPNTKPVEIHLSRLLTEIIHILAGKISTVAAMADVSFLSIVILFDPPRQLWSANELLTWVKATCILVGYHDFTISGLQPWRVALREKGLEADSVEHHGVKRCLFCNVLSNVSVYGAYVHQHCYLPLDTPFAMDMPVDS